MEDNNVKDNNIIFKNDILGSLQIFNYNTEENEEIYSNWLRKAPKYTSLRINTLKNFEMNKLTSALEEMAEKLSGTPKIPPHYKYRDDCIILEQWCVDDVHKVDGAPNVIIDNEASAAVLRGAKVYAPAVLGVPIGLKPNALVNIYADVEHKCTRGLMEEFGGLKRFVGLGIMKMSRDQLYRSEKPKGIAIEPLMPVSKIPVINETIAPPGELLLQNLPSMVCSWVLDPKPGEVILDMCAAPGNKTTHLAELSKNQAKIYALDKIASKITEMKLKRLAHDATCIKVFCHDSVNAVTDEVKSLDEGPPFTRCTFDKILLDPPCSGIGKRPVLFNEISPKTLASFPRYQKKFFKCAVQLLKPGGRLVYSTCTISPDENERMVAWALELFPELKLVPATPLLGGPGWSMGGLLSDDERIMVQRFGPENDPLRPVEDIFKDTVGFFIACFEKIKP